MPNSLRNSITDIFNLQPLLMTLEPEQQQAATQLTHYMNTVMCLVAEHFTSLER